MELCLLALLTHSLTHVVVSIRLANVASRSSDGNKF
jgi:hypothetical protein